MCDIGRDSSPKRGRSASPPMALLTLTGTFTARAPPLPGLPQHAAPKLSVTQCTLHTQRPNCLPKPSQNESTHFHYQHGRHCSTKDAPRARAAALQCTALTHSLARRRLLHYTARHPRARVRSAKDTRHSNPRPHAKRCTTRPQNVQSYPVAAHIPDKLLLEIGHVDHRALHPRSQNAPRARYDISSTARAHPLRPAAQTASLPAHNSTICTRTLSAAARTP